MKWSTIIAICLSLIFLNVQADEIAPNKTLKWSDLRVADQDFSNELFEKRQKMLKGHQHLAALTLGLALVSGVTAVMGKKKIEDARNARGGVKSGSDADELHLHILTAGATMVSYLTTAYFSINAPKAESMQDSDGLKWHKRFAMVHFPAMVLGPVMGLMAYNQYKNGKDPKGISKLHGPVMALGVASLLGAAIAIEF